MIINVLMVLTLICLLMGVILSLLSRGTNSKDKKITLSYWAGAILWIGCGFSVSGILIKIIERLA